ncbi:MAG TPA: sulfite exporter TauE/SafE family protein [Clostridiales bacterium UBA8960]|jgi:uncharacterized membrane protein YfcA|nr:sulfite exporter TauE/SafE family protein [Clostridiales bacterium UBA8960]
MDIIFASIIIFFAALVQGATSFGFSLIALPLLGLIFELKVVVPTLVLFSIVLNLIILVKLRIRPVFKEIGLLTLFAILFIPLGVRLLLFVDERILKACISILLIGIALIMLKGYKLNIKNKTVSYIITGILSGILNGAVSLSGPPVVVLLANDNKNKVEFRSSLTFLFITLNIVTIILYYNKGLFNNPTLVNMVSLLPVMVIGTFSGIYLGNKIDDVKFKKMVLVLLLFMGAMNLI